MLMVPSLNANEVGVYIVGNICSKVKQAFRLVWWSASFASYQNYS